MPQRLWKRWDIVAADLALAPSMEPSSMLLAPSWTLSATLASVASATMLLAMLLCLHRDHTNVRDLQAPIHRLHRHSF